MPAKTQKISAIIPVYNEEKTVGKVVLELLKSELISEVICVNDGSTDGSLKILKSFGKKIVLIDLKENRGKGHALAAGIERANGEVVLFMDSDMINLNQSHIKTILEPILAKKTVGVIGSLPRQDGKYERRCLHRKAEPQLGSRITPILKKLWLVCVPDKTHIALSGLRAYYRKDLLPYLCTIKNSRFGAEILLNRIYADKKVEKVVLQGLLHLNKPEKMGIGRTCRQYLIEGYEIGAEILRMNLKKREKPVKRR